MKLGLDPLGLRLDFRTPQMTQLCCVHVLGTEAGMQMSCNSSRWHTTGLISECPCFLIDMYCPYPYTIIYFI